LVGVVNLFHPIHASPTGAYQGLQHHVSWWIALHTINLGAFALLGLAVFLLVRDTSGVGAIVSRVAIAVYVPLYVAFDTLIGIGTGTLIQYAKTLPPAELAPVESAIDVVWQGSLSYTIAALASIAWSVALLAAAVAHSDPRRRVVTTIIGVSALAVNAWAAPGGHVGAPVWWGAVAAVGAIALLVGRPRLPVGMLILAAVLFGATHVPPFGPLGMLCFVTAAAWLTFRAEPNALQVDTRSG
jgi:hypothetical protein